MTTKTIASVGLALILTATTAEARFICGATQMAHYGITDTKYRLARNWADMPHVSAQPGAVVVQTRRGRALGGGPGGHVSRIVQPISECRAIVADEKGQYERDICKNRVALVVPRAGNAMAALTDTPRPRHKSKHAGRIQLASHSATDRHSVQ